MKIPRIAPCPRLGFALAESRAVSQFSAARAFTLIELLAVIMIIGVVAAILIPTVSRVRESARTAICSSNLRQIGTAALLWAGEHKGRMPGTGTLASTGYSANWQDVLNAAVFPAYSNNSVAVLQRSGDTPRDGTMYCPSIRRWSSVALQQSSVRAYVANAHVIAPANAPDGGAFGPFSAYNHGAPLVTFQNPAGTFYVWESEMVSDVLRVSSAANVPAPSGSISFDNTESDEGKDMSPASANNRVYAFRHGNSLNVLFLDGHVGRYTPETFGALNTLSSFRN